MAYLSNTDTEAKKAIAARYTQFNGRAATALGWRQKFIVKQALAHCARDMQTMERELRAEGVDYPVGPMPSWRECCGIGAEYALDALAAGWFYADYMTARDRAWMFPCYHDAVIAYVSELHVWHVRQSRLDREHCPGCDAGPGDGVTPNCDDELGCGFYHAIGVRHDSCK